MNTLGNQEAINRVRAYMQSLQEEYSAQKIYPRTVKIYPFDHIGLALISKAFSISNALLVLLESGYADEAFGLSRTLVECALTLRFLTQNHSELNQRTWSYMRFEIADKQYWMYYALQNSTTDEMKHRIYERAKPFNWEPDARGIAQHWSGKDGFAWKVNRDDHPLDNTTSTESTKKTDYAVAYHATSSFVHCYSPVVNNFLPTDGVAFEVQKSSEQWHKLGQTTLFNLICNLHECVAYTLFGMNIERTQKMNDLFSETLNSLQQYLK